MTSKDIIEALSIKAFNNIISPNGTSMVSRGFSSLMLFLDCIMNFCIYNKYSWSITLQLATQLHHFVNKNKHTMWLKMSLHPDSKNVYQGVIKLLRKKCLILAFKYTVYKKKPNCGAKIFPQLATLSQIWSTHTKYLNS